MHYKFFQQPNSIRDQEVESNHPKQVMSSQCHKISQGRQKPTSFSPLSKDGKLLLYLFSFLCLKRKRGNQHNCKNSRTGRQEGLQKNQTVLSPPPPTPESQKELMYHLGYCMLLLALLRAAQVPLIFLPFSYHSHMLSRLT